MKSGESGWRGVSVQGRRVRAAEARGKTVGGDQQREREQNTQGFHVGKVTLSEF